MLKSKLVFLLQHILKIIARAVLIKPRSIPALRGCIENVEIINCGSMDFLIPPDFEYFLSLRLNSNFFDLNPMDKNTPWTKRFLSP